MALHKFECSYKNLAYKECDRLLLRFKVKVNQVRYQVKIFYKYRKFSLLIFGKFLFPTNIFYPSIIIIIY